MSNKNRPQHFFRSLIICCMALLLSLVSFVPAYAVTSEELQAKVDKARANLDDLYSKAEVASEELNATQAQLDQTKSNIEKKQSEIQKTSVRLQDTQLSLSDNISSFYKSGGVSLLSIILGSSSPEELVTNIYYAQKMAESQTAAIDKVNKLKAQLTADQKALEKQKAEQEKLYSEQKEQKDELTAAADEAQTYYDALDKQLKDKIAEEEAAEQAAAEAAAAAAIAQAQREAAQHTAAPAQNSSGSSQSAPQSKPGNTGSHSGGNSSGPVEGWRSVVVSAAYSKIGSPYVWGGKGPNAFDCSGFTAWCYKQAGISIPSYSEAQAAFCNKPLSQAQPGDVVYRYGHVGIYIGNGQTIEAHNERLGVDYGFSNISSRFTSCGSPV